MSPLDDLPPDQRAVLQLVLGRGRSYEEIANLLSIDPAAVRQRALDALATLVPDAEGAARERELITDYLLGQLPQRVAGEVVGYLAGAPADRQWALAVRRALVGLTSGALPEIPVEAPLGPDPDSAAEPAPVPIAPEPELRRDPVPTPERAARRGDSPPPRGSRRGGAILLAGVAVVVVAVVVILLVGGGASKSRSPGRTIASTSTTADTQTTSTPGGASTTKAAKPKLLAALNLTSPAGDSKAVAVVQVIRVSGVTGIAIDAQGMPPNTAHNAYAVWLYSSATSSRFVGFVPKLVGKDGKLQTDGKLPADAAKYKRLLITLETQSDPKTPGQVILSGPFRERS